MLPNMAGGVAAEVVESRAAVARQGPRWEQPGLVIGIQIGLQGLRSSHAESRGPREGKGCAFAEGFDHIIVPS